MIRARVSFKRTCLLQLGGEHGGCRNGEKVASLYMGDKNTAIADGMLSFFEVVTAMREMQTGN